MARNDSLFLISGLMSLSLFTFFLVLFFSMLFSSSKIDTYALKKDNYISVSIEIPKLETKKSVNIPAAAKPIESVEKKEIDIDNLFSEVTTKDIKKKKTVEKKIDEKRLQNIQKRIKTTKNNKASDISKKVSEIDTVKSKSDSTPTSSSSEVNEYLAKIQALVYKHFSPPQNSQGNSVKAVVHLSAIGKALDFRILNYSTNDALNKECDKIKDRLMSVVFPINPQNKSGNYIIILTSKE